MTTQLEQATQPWRVLAEDDDVTVAPRPVTTGEMLRRFGTEELLVSTRSKRADHHAGHAVATRSIPVVAHPHAHRRASYVRLRRERVLMILATLTLGLAITGLAYAASLLF